MKFLCLLAVVAVCSAGMWKLDEADRVIRVFDTPHVRSERAQKILSEIDVWGRAEDGGFDMRVSPVEMEALRLLGVNFTETTETVQKHFDWMASNEQLCTKSVDECIHDGNFYATYQRLAAIQQYLAELIGQYPSLMTTKSWGNSLENRDMRGVVVTSPNSAPNKPVVFYFCGEHAREWLPVMFCMWMIENLAQGYGSNNRVTAIMDRYAFHVLPVMNPDGYEFSQTSNSMWRKNRQTNTGSTCIGTDLNRNYQFQWNTGGSSPNPCTDTFHGARPWSAPETENLRAYAANTPIVIQTDVHAYGNMWMYPWGYTYTLPPHNTAMLRCADATALAIRNTGGQVFRTGSIANVIYIASGSSCDNFYGLNNVIYSYAPEVRGTSFQPPVSNIAPSNAELWAGMLAQVECVASATDEMNLGQ